MSSKRWLAIRTALLFGTAIAASAAVSQSSLMLAAETNGLAFVSNDTGVSDYGSLTIKDTVTPANTYSGAPFTFQGGKLSHDRTSLALEQNASGVWKWAGHNLVTGSTDLSTWTANSCTRAASAEVTPDGDTSASLLTATAATNVSMAFTYTNPDAEAVTVCRVKAGTTSWFALSNATFFAYFDLANIVTGTVESGSGSITDLGNGWRLCKWTQPNSATTVRLRVVDGNNSTAVTIGRTLHVWKPHVYRSNVISENYVATGASAVHLPKRHRDAALTNRGYWPEEARTNLALWSDDFRAALWLKTGVTAAFTATGADGVANSATTLTATTANGYAVQNITSASAQRVTSVAVKRRTGSGVVTLAQSDTTGSDLITNGTFTTDATGWTASTANVAASVVAGQLNVTNNGAGWVYQSFATTIGKVYRLTIDFVTKAGGGRIFVGTAIGSSTLTSSTVAGLGQALVFVATTTTTFVSLGDSSGGAGTVNIYDNISNLELVETTLSLTSSWQRLSTAAATITNPSLIIKLATSGDEIDVQYVQCEAGNTMTSPIPTTTASVTRAADSIANFTALNMSATENTLFAEFSVLTTASRLGVVVAIDAGTTGTSSQIAQADAGWTAAGTRIIGSADNGANQAALSLADVSLANRKVAFGMKANDFAASIDGAAVVTDVAGTVPAYSSLSIGGRRSTTNPHCGYITKIMHLPRRMTDAELVTLST